MEDIYTKPKLTEIYSCRMDEDTRRWLRSYSFGNGMSMNKIMLDALKEFRSRHSSSSRRRPVKVL